MNNTDCLHTQNYNTHITINVRIRRFKTRSAAVSRALKTNSRPIRLIDFGYKQHQCIITIISKHAFNSWWKYHVQKLFMAWRNKPWINPWFLTLCHNVINLPTLNIITKWIPSIHEFHYNQQAIAETNRKKINK